ncbi:MAG TPA: helix-turn-helix transcriptional regulator [Bacteroidales bacterium]|nr:helix-turn-helix transcriptional regulator [Bacteroidales bacterium]
MNEREAVFKEYYETLNSQHFIEADLDYSLLDKHIEFLDKLNVVENSSISIFDLFRQKHIYLSSHFEQLFKYNITEAHQEGNAYFNSKVHPDDFLAATKIGNYFLRLGFSLPPEQRKEFKLINEYRIRDGTGKYIRVIEQFQALELDKHGNIWLALCIMDLSPNQDITLPLKNNMYNFKTGESFHFPHDQKEGNLSVREKEILGLISEGMASKEIADSLFISTHTVNTHRQKILKKLNVKNSAEAVQYARRYGLF